MLVTVIAALALGWWLDRSQLANEVKRLTKKPSLLEEINLFIKEEEEKEQLNSKTPAPNLPKP